MSLIGGMVCAAVGFKAVVVAPALLLSAAVKSGRPLLHCSLCIVMLACGWGLERRSRPAHPSGISTIPIEREFQGRLLSLPEADDRGGYSLRLRGGRLKVLLKVAPSPESARWRVERLRTGDTIRLWCRLKKPRGHANPGSGDPALWMRAKGVDAVGSVKSARLIELVASGSPGPRRWLDDAKSMARESLDISFGREGDVRAMMGAMLLGDRAGLPAEQVRALRYAGLIHLVAISGLHVGLLAMLLFGGLRRARCAPWLLLALALILLPAFGVVVGARPSVLRAAAASILILLGRWCGREGDSFNSLLLVASAFLLFEPTLLHDAGFQLTFMATAGIMLMASPLASRLPLPAVLALPAALSAAAYLGCAPLLAHHFGWLAPVALLSNLAAAPLCAVIIISGYGSMLVSWLPPAHDAMALLGELSISTLMKISEIGGGLPFAGWRLPPPGFAFSLFYYLLLGGIVRRRGGPPLLALFMLLLAWLHLGNPPAPSGRTRAALLDVGQGQCMAVQGPEGRVALIDAGGSPGTRFDPGERVVLPFISSWNRRRIELFAISHGDLDHAGGAFAVIRELEVEKLWLAPGYHRDPLLQELAGAARLRGTALVLAERGMIDNAVGLPIEVLGPGRGDNRLKGNDRSLVLRLGNAPCRLLIPGDLERAGEEALIAAGAELEAEALVVAHHGSAGGSGDAFLARVRPLLAIVSCGFGNRYGHPRREVVGRIAECGASLWRTDWDGMLLLEAGAGGWRVRTTRGRRRKAPE